MINDDGGEMVIALVTPPNPKRPPAERLQSCVVLHACGYIVVKVKGLLLKIYCTSHQGYVQFIHSFTFK